MTGASSGIGAAIARHALDRGARVAGLARRADRLGAIDDLVAIPVDVTDPAAATAAVQAAIAALGGLDALVNAAGINRPGLVADTDHADWSAVFATNVLGLLSVTRAAMAPTAAHTGKRAAPTTPMVRGISMRVLSSSFLMVIRRMFPS